MTREGIANRLEEWADEAGIIADAMRERGFMTWDCHAGELDGAARMAREWAREIRHNSGPEK
jgi:hypothetical protein